MCDVFVQNPLFIYFSHFMWCHLTSFATLCILTHSVGFGKMSLKYTYHSKTLLDANRTKPESIYIYAFDRKIPCWLVRWFESWLKCLWCWEVINHNSSTAHKSYETNNGWHWPCGIPMVLCRENLFKFSTIWLWAAKWYSPAVDWMIYGQRFMGTKCFIDC